MEYPDISKTPLMLSILICLAFIGSGIYFISTNESLLGRVLIILGLVFFSIQQTYKKKK
jgi:hypothetical protein